MTRRLGHVDARPRRLGTERRRHFGRPTITAAFSRWGRTAMWRDAGTSRATADMPAATGRIRSSSPAPRPSRSTAAHFPRASVRAVLGRIPGIVMLETSMRSRSTVTGPTQPCPGPRRAMPRPAPRSTPRRRGEGRLVRSRERRRQDPAQSLPYLVGANLRRASGSRRNRSGLPPDESPRFPSRSAGLGRSGTPVAVGTRQPSGHGTGSPTRPRRQLSVRAGGRP
jgi:hypothetical protein